MEKKKIWRKQGLWFFFSAITSSVIAVVKFILQAPTILSMCISDYVYWLSCISNEVCLCVIWRGSSILFTMEKQIYTHTKIQKTSKEVFFKTLFWTQDRHFCTVFPLFYCFLELQQMGRHIAKPLLLGERRKSQYLQRVCIKQKVFGFTLVM